MSWLDTIKTAGTAALSTVQLVGRLLYTLSTPLRWPLYYIYATISYLLSPVWAIANLGVRAAAYAVGLVASFKYLYIYVSFFVVAFISYRIQYSLGDYVRLTTFSFIAILFGWDGASERRKRRDQHYLESRHPSAIAHEDDENEYNDDSSSSAKWQRSDMKESPGELDPNELFEKQWKLVRKPIQPGRRRKGLLGQTIHEESSESDLSIPARMSAANF
ncbi:hypothetical protein NPX13_g1595 [Xylaria arbuscula]|uniref:Uncharacterized protein n=1 Tax=Xylaria arbuscula TaxID=114810 RepID=A0A9W8TRQ8_9PEZI|nr:hypothetical protein NPX13_g1595 [Xylaria arbuscula]